MKLEGRHVVLAPLGLEHAAALTAIATGPRDSFAFTFVPKDGEAVHRYIETATAEAERGEALPFAIVTRDSGRVVGSTRLGHVERWTWPEPRWKDTPDAAEIGWTWLDPSVQRTAVNTESKRLLLGHAFETWEVERISFIADVRNVRSRAAIERLGAKLDGIVRAHFPAADGTVRDSASYSILKREWPTVRDTIDAYLAR